MEQNIILNIQCYLTFNVLYFVLDEIRARRASEERERR